ncbi:MAG: hypothetical protein NC548_62855 [Lachnospiraceae bacterium]|nr:hypothetical protein [Lachnospiraceae bacterium]
MSKTLQEHDGIQLGDCVRINGDERCGYIASIIDYGTHIVYFVDFGDIIKFPAKREWITKMEN